MMKPALTSLLSGAVKAALATAILGMPFGPAQACPDEPYTGTICFTGANFCPSDYYYEAAGQLISIKQNPALYSLLGTSFGGDGVNTFGLPDLRARMPVAYGASPGTLDQTMGLKTGTDARSLTLANLSGHTHNATFDASKAGGLTAKVTLTAEGSAGEVATPTSATWLAGATKSGTAVPMWTGDSASTAVLNGLTVAINGSLTGGKVTNATTGANQSFTTLPPQVGLTACIAFTGTYPPRP